jgi:hypothetical protein
MTDDDERLSDLLGRWSSPAVPPDLDDRVIAAYRRQTGRPSWWRLFLTTEVRIPLPVAAVLALLLIVSAIVAIRPPATGGSAVAPMPAPLQNAQVAPPAVVTETSLAGFRPVEEMRVTVVKGKTP